MEEITAKEMKMAVRELKRGRESAIRLIEQLREGSTADISLAEEVASSFSRALTALELGESSDVSQETSAASSKKRPRLASRKIRTLSPQWTEISTTLEDGGAWRKYGQKPIHGAAHPRSYFRCSHKQDQGCLAKRRVQKVKENPDSFLITYTGRHSCQATAGKVTAKGVDDFSDLSSLPERSPAAGPTLARMEELLMMPFNFLWDQ